MAVVASDNAALACEFGHKRNTSTTQSHHILGGQSLKRELSQRITEPTVRHTILGVVHRDLELFRSPKLLTVEVLIDKLVCSILKVLTVGRRLICERLDVWEGSRCGRRRMGTHELGVRRLSAGVTRGRAR